MTYNKKNKRQTLATIRTSIRKPYLAHVVIKRMDKTSIYYPKLASAKRLQIILDRCLIRPSDNEYWYQPWLVDTKPPKEKILLNYACSCYAAESSICMVHGCVG